MQYSDIHNKHVCSHALLTDTVESSPAGQEKYFDNQLMKMKKKLELWLFNY